MPQFFRFATDEDRLKSDYVLCARQADDGFERQEHFGLRLRLPGVWRDWREMGALKFGLLEDIPEPAPGGPKDCSSIVAFAIVIFLRDEFVQQAIADPTPNLALRVVQRHIDGKSPVLTLEEIAAANASQEPQLNMFMAHYTERFPDSYNQDAKEQTRNLMMRKFLETQHGFNLKRVFYEVFGKAHYDYALTTGMQRLSGYYEYYAEPGRQLPDEEARPYLVGITFNTVKYGSTIASLFRSSPPRFGFDVKQQVLLWTALFVDDDETEIARNLSDSVVASRFFLKRKRSLFSLERRLIKPIQVRNCWRSILETVESVDEGFFAARASDREDVGFKQKKFKQEEGGLDSAAGNRKKRKKVLKYIREHIEELQPSRPELRNILRIGG